MNKNDLINVLQHELDAHRELLAGSTTKKEAAQILDAVVCAITKGLFEEGEVSLPGLGKLKTAARAARTGRNPQTGAEIEIPARTTVKFSTSKALDEALNP